MAVEPLETEVWKTLEIRGKRVGFSSLGRFQDSNGIKKTVTPSKGGYCSVRIASKLFQFHDLMCTAFHGENLLRATRWTTSTSIPPTTAPTIYDGLLRQKIYKRVTASTKTGNHTRRNRAFQSLDASINPRMSGSCTRT